MSGTNGLTRQDDRRVGVERRITAGAGPDEERRVGQERREEAGQAWEAGPAIEGPDGPTPIVAFQPEGVDPASATGPAAWAGDPSAREHDAIPSMAAVGGHPLHPMVVPIPIASLAFTVVADLAYALTRDRFWARAGRILTAVGAVSGVGAGALGAVDFLGRSRVRDHGGAWLHAGGNVAAVALSAASFAMRSGRRATPLPGPLLLSAAAAVILLVTGWLGGELSYRHRVGVTAGSDGH